MSHVYSISVVFQSNLYQFFVFELVKDELAIIES